MKTVTSKISRLPLERDTGDETFAIRVDSDCETVLAFLGGYSAPRTHRGKERFPVMTITYYSIQMVDTISETPDKAKIITCLR